MPLNNIANKQSARSYSPPQHDGFGGTHPFVTRFLYSVTVRDIKRMSLQEAIKTIRTESFLLPTR